MLYSFGHPVWSELVVMSVTSTQVTSAMYKDTISPAVPSFPQASSVRGPVPAEITKTVIIVLGW